MTETGRALRLLAPYLAVGVFWCGLSNGWLAILAYHAQILFWMRRDGPPALRPRSRSALLYALPAVVAGPVAYFLLPYMVHTDPGGWLVDHRLGGLSFLVMIPYFGLVHPVLEQIHWAPLRNATPLAHPAFAGYHMLVLYSLLSWPWLIVCFVVLTAASFAWHEMTRRSGSLAAPILMHILADLGIILAAFISLELG